MNPAATDSQAGIFISDKAGQSVKCRAAPFKWRKSFENCDVREKFAPKCFKFRQLPEDTSGESQIVTVQCPVRYTGVSKISETSHVE